MESWSAGKEFKHVFQEINKYGAEQAQMQHLTGGLPFFLTLRIADQGAKS